MTRTRPLICLVVILALLGEVRSEKSDEVFKCKECKDDSCKVTYGNIGCFETRSQCGEDSKDDKSPQLPDTPEDEATTFLLYDKIRVDFATEFHRGDIAQLLLNSGFDPTKDTKIIIHGIMGPNFYGLLEHLKEQFFVKGFNIFMVNWQPNVDTGSVDKDKIEKTYRKAVANARLVGRMLGMFLEYLHDTFSVSYDSMHIVGHNVGSHAAGYAGKYIRDRDGDKVARITGLAPSRPYVEWKQGDNMVLKPKECRLDKDDAKFVDTIHADMPSEARITMGLKEQIGHVDFYANDGKDPQPGCKYMFCSHGRPLEYYEQSIKGTCTFQSEKCPWDKDRTCPADGCPVMGYNVNVNARGYYCVKTTEYEPFCKKQTNKQANKQTSNLP